MSLRRRRRLPPIAIGTLTPRWTALCAMPIAEASCWPNRAVSWATDRKTGNLVNEEAYVQYKFADNYAITAGQYKELIYQETATSSKRLLAVERSLAAQFLFGGDAYSQGVLLSYSDANALQASL